RGFEAEGTVHRTGPVADAVRGERGGEVVGRVVAQFEARLAAERIIIPVVGGDAAREQRDGFGQEREHVGPKAEAQAARGGEGVEFADVVREVRGQADGGDLGAGERVSAEVKRFVEADVDEAGGAERGDVAQQGVGDVESAGVQRANLPGRQRFAGGGV